MSFKSDLLKSGSPDVTAYAALWEVAKRLGETNEFTLTPRRAAQVIASVLAEVDEVRAELEESKYAELAP